MTKWVSFFPSVQSQSTKSSGKLNKPITSGEQSSLFSFAKRLKIDPKLATQDSSVISVMKSAVHKTIGKTADAQIDLTTPTKDEKEYEGEDYGDN